jgi:hypothetical protein
VAKGLLRLDPKLLGALFGLTVERAELHTGMAGEQELRLIVEDPRIPIEDPLPEVVPTIDRERPELRLGWELLGRPSAGLPLRPRS